MTQRDMLDGDVGLPDNYRFKVESAEFNYDSQYNNGQTLLLILHGTRTHEDGEVQREQREVFSCGNKWIQRDGGQLAVHETKGEPWDTSLGEKAPRFNKQTKVFGFIKRLSELGLGDRLREGVDGKGLYNAQTFVGLELTMKQEDYKNPTTGEVKSTAMPVAVAGVTAPANSSPTPAAAAPAAPATASGNGTSNDVRQALKAKAAEIKAGGGDQNAFVSAATAIAGWDAYAVEVTDGTIFAEV